MPVATGAFRKLPAGVTRAGISPPGAAGLPCARTRCRPTPRRGLSRASATASAAASPVTMRLVLVRIPSRWARTTAQDRVEGDGVAGERREEDQEVLPRHHQEGRRPPAPHLLE